MSLPPLNGSSPPQSPTNPEKGKKTKKGNKGKGKGKKPTYDPSRQGSTSAVEQRKASAPFRPITTRKTAAAFLKQKELESLPLMYGDKAKQIYEGFLKQVECISAIPAKTTSAVGDSQQANLIRAICYCETHQYEAALFNAEKCMTQTPNTDKLYPSICFWLGRIRYNINNNIFNEAIAKLFLSAYAGGNPLAAKYLMQAHCGLDFHLSVIKWCDPLKVISIAVQTPQLFEQRLKELISQNSHQRINQTEKLNGLLNEVLLSVESENFITSSRDILICMTQLCDLYIKPTKEITHVCKTLKETTDMFDDDNSQQIIGILQHYALVKRFYNSSESLKSLKEHPFYISQLCAGDILRESPSPEECMPHLKAAYPIIHGYTQMGHYFIEQKQFSDALETYKEAVTHLYDFLDGTKTLFGKNTGDQSKELKKFGFTTELTNEINFEELTATHEFIRFFEGQIDLMSEVIEKDFPKQPTTLSVKQSEHSDRPSEADSSSSESSCHSDSEALDHLDTDSAKHEVPQEKEAQESTGFIKIKRRSRKTTSMPSISQPLLKTRNMQEWRIKAAISKANQLGTKEEKFDEAERILLGLNIDEASPLIYIQKQTLHWIRLQKAIKELYTPSGNHKEAQTILNKVEKDTLDLIRSLERKVLTESMVQIQLQPNPHLPDSSIPPIKIKIANQLEVTDPLLRRQYGALYSVMGHLQKAYKQSSLSPKPANHYNTEGIRYYTIANYIRRRPGFVQSP